MISRFTAAELDILRVFDALIDDAPMTRADFDQVDFDDSILFPETTRERERDRAKRERQKAAQIERGEYDAIRERGRQYRETHREQIKARRAAYYQANKERISAAQRAYRMRVAAATVCSMV